MKQKRKTQSKLFWERHMKMWHASGLSIAAYCRQQNIATSTFHGHAKKLAAPSDFQLMKIPEAILHHCNQEIEGSGLYVEFTNGVKLQIQNHFNSETFVRVVQSMATL